MTVAASLLVLKLSISGLFRGAAGQDGEKVQKPSCKANEKTNKRLIIEGERYPERCRGEQKRWECINVLQWESPMRRSAEVLRNSNIFWRKQTLF